MYYAFLPVILFPLVIFLLVSMLLPKASGWTELVKNYRSVNDFEGERWNMRSAKMNLINYNGCLNFGSSRNGLFISVMFPFNFGSKPLLIPWTDISIRNEKGWVFEYMVLNFKKNPGVDIKIQKKFWNKILQSIYTPKELSNIKGSHAN